MILFSTSANEPLARRVAKEAKIRLGKRLISSFTDGELSVQITESSRKQETVILASLHQPDRNLLELLWLINAARKWNGRKPTVIAPYLGYARQDRAEPKGSTVAAETVAQMIKSVGVKKILTIDIHSKQAANYIRIPYQDLTAIPLLVKSLKIKPAQTVIVAPDAGAIRRAEMFSKLSRVKNLAVIQKKRPRPGHAVAVRLEGDVAEKDIVIVDDMIDSGGTIIAATKLLKKHGARSIKVAATHGIFSKGALTKLKAAGIARIITTDTIPQKNKPTHLKVISVAPMLAKYLKSI
ncbi:ribose-phosphate pyrophosphokinase [Patescibacteria group bacterium]|nr:ribose-phosphate pyrophosphokinase [Patescibacteria group bacterium]